MFRNNANSDLAAGRHPSARRHVGASHRDALHRRLNDGQHDGNANSDPAAEGHPGACLHGDACAYCDACPHGDACPYCDACPHGDACPYCDAYPHGDALHRLADGQYWGEPDLYDAPCPRGVSHGDLPGHHGRDRTGASSGQ